MLMSAERNIVSCVGAIVTGCQSSQLLQRYSLRGIRCAILGDSFEDFAGMDPKSSGAPRLCEVEDITLAFELNMMPEAVADSS